MQFSDTVLDHFYNPRQIGRLDRADGEGEERSPQTGIVVRIQVTTDGDSIRDVRFQTHGCVTAIAAASRLCEWALGKSLAEALQRSARSLIDDLGGLPIPRLFCADLAVRALRRAIADAVLSEQENKNA